MAEIVREVASEYGESADNMEQAFTGGSSQIDEIREKQEALDGWADEIEQAASEFEDWDGPEAGEGTEDDAPGEVGAEKNSSGETREDWVEAQREKANEAIGECPV